MAKEKESKDNSVLTEKKDEKSDKKLISRLNRIGGQVNGLKKQLGKNSSCTDMLVQASAVRAGIEAFMREIIERHIRSSVQQDLIEGNDESLEKLIWMIDKFC